MLDEVRRIQARQNLRPSQNWPIRLIKYRSNSNPYRYGAIKVGKTQQVSHPSRLRPPSKRRVTFDTSQALPLKALFLLLLSFALTVCEAPGVSIRFSDVEATFHLGRQGALLKAVDGVDAGREGWSVYPHVSVPQSAVFVVKDPMVAGRIRFSLCFLSGQKDAHFNEFSISATSDTAPSLAGSWERLHPWQIYSTGTELQVQPPQKIRSKGSALNTEFLVECLLSPKPITGIRIDVFPCFWQTTGELYLSESTNHDFVLSELRVEAFDTETTNVALGTPVRASRAIWGQFRPEFLTDGLAATFAHPKDPDLEGQFFYEIDLGKVRSIDHISLRGRGDKLSERLSKVILSLFSEPSDADAEPTWKGLLRSDGSYPPLGTVDVVRAQAGSGQFAGRYLRVSSASTVAYSPQISEVEVYESLLPQLMNLRADHQNIELSRNIAIAPGVRWLAFALKTTQKHLPKKVPFRWRMNSSSGDDAQWASANSEGIAEGACPPPGLYTFESQVGHTDGQWNEASLKIPILVHKPWWQKTFVQVTTLGALLGLAVWLIRFFARRQLESQVHRLEHLQALNEERARIARDMHDVVGARLTQLSVMHDIFAREYPLSDSEAARLKQLSGTAREAIAALDEVVWTVNPRNDSLLNFADYICHCATEYLSPLKIACYQDLPADWPELLVGAQIRHEVLLAFKEALQNVVKHASATEVFLSLSCENGTFTVCLEDNGKGLPVEILGKERDGLSNMVTRLSHIGGTCQIFPRENTGTAVVMKVLLIRTH